MYSFILT